MLLGTDNDNLTVNPLKGMCLDEQDRMSSLNPNLQMLFLLQPLLLYCYKRVDCNDFVKNT
jgi:hypothetical protein